MNRGEVWWVEDPELGRRPYLVLTRQSAIDVLNAVLSVPASRTIRGAPSEIKLDRDDGMPEECALSFDNIATIPKGFFVERICRLSVTKLELVCRVVAIATGC
jgi:mRNA interferase MazF